MQRFYFDHNATTPVSPEVLEAMLPVMTEVYGNASSIHHFGQTARQKLEAARRQVAAMLGADPQEIVFTSGGTEADNLAIFGTMHVRACDHDHYRASRRARDGGANGSHAGAGRWPRHGRSGCHPARDSARVRNSSA